MKQEERGKLNKIISLVLLFLWCILIFYFSNQNGTVSENSSSRILLFLNSILNIFSSNIYLTKSLVATFIVRKLAHMFLYFILFIICNYVCYSYKISKKYLYSLFFCLIYACSDEIHQLFIFERSFGITDIGIDFIGSLIGLSFVKLLKKNKI